MEKQQNLFSAIATVENVNELILYLFLRKLLKEYMMSSSEVGDDNINISKLQVDNISDMLLENLESKGLQNHNSTKFESKGSRGLETGSRGLETNDEESII